MTPMSSSDEENLENSNQNASTECSVRMAVVSVTKTWFLHSLAKGSHQAEREMREH